VNTPNEAMNTLNPNKIAIPIAIGIGAMIVLIFSNDSIDFQMVWENLKNAKIYWVFLAFLVLAIRDLGYMYRIRHLTKKELSWVSSFFIIVLWEFSSAITPSVVGGTAVAVFIINQEKIPLGRSLAYVLLTASLDNLFFVLASLSVIFFLPYDIFPVGGDTFKVFGYELPLRGIFTVSVSLIAIYNLLMTIGLFFAPRAFKRFLGKLTSFSFTKKWRRSAIQIGNDMIIGSMEMKGHNWIYWVKAMLSTVFIWSARYLMLNCLIAAFSDIDLSEHLIIFARQIIMWIIMLISPTPGSSGTAELSFKLFFDEFFTAGFVLIVAILWRLLTYYAYLVAGAIVIPRWIRRVMK